MCKKWASFVKQTMLYVERGEKGLYVSLYYFDILLVNVA